MGNEGVQKQRELFNSGAQAMQGRIAAWLLMQGHVVLAPKILEISLPEFRVPEKMVVEEKKDDLHL